MQIPHSKPLINQASVQRVAEQIGSGSLANGTVTLKFSQCLKDYLHAESVFLTPNGAAALLVALSALDIGFGDEVILPTYVCHAVADTILFLGATPVFCDIGESWVMTRESVAAVFTERTRAIIVVHIYGILAPASLFKGFGVPVIEDCCQCLTSEIEGNRPGAECDIAFYSFHATKCLTAGEGGAVACFGEKYRDRLAKAHAKHAVFLPFTEGQAALGLSQLEIYPQMLERRLEIAQYYFENLPESLTRQLRAVSASMYFRFPLRMQKGFEAARREAENSGIAIRKGVDELLHQRYGCGKTGYPVAERLFASTVCIPIYPALTDGEMRAVVNAIRRIGNED